MDDRDQVFKGCLGLAVIVLGAVFSICFSIGIGFVFGAGFGSIALSFFALVFSLLSLRAFKKAVK